MLVPVAGLEAASTRPQPPGIPAPREWRAVRGRSKIGVKSSWETSSQAVFTRDFLRQCPRHVGGCRLWRLNQLVPCAHLGTPRMDGLGMSPNDHALCLEAPANSISWCHRLLILFRIAVACLEIDIIGATPSMLQTGTGVTYPAWVCPSELASKHSVSSDVYLASTR